MKRDPIDVAFETLNLLSDEEFFGKEKPDCEVCLADNLSHLCYDTSCLCHNNHTCGAEDCLCHGPV